MNYNELKELLSKYGFCIEKIEPYDRTLYCFTNNPLFLTEEHENVFATAKFGKGKKLLCIVWFDKISISDDLLIFDNLEKGVDYDSKDLPQKIEKRFGLVEKNIKKAATKLKLKEINKDFKL